MTTNLNIALVESNKRFLRLMIGQLETDGLEMALAMEEVATEIRQRKANAVGTLPTALDWFCLCSDN